MLEDQPIDCFIGNNISRVEDDKLLNGKGQFGSDTPFKPDALHAVVLRSEYASAKIKKINFSKAQKLKGVYKIITGKDFSEISNPLLSVIRTEFKTWCCAIDEVHYVGEPIAIILATSRYIGEDALQLIDVEYSVNQPVISIKDALNTTTKFVHKKYYKSNVVSDRNFEYGEPNKFFTKSHKVVEIEVEYPRNSCTPLEGFVVHSEYDNASGVYNVKSNFQGPFSLHSVLSRALKVEEGNLRLISFENSGGSFGIKQAIMPMIILTCLASRLSNKQVVWVEDRMEHLTAASSATGRLTKIKASIDDQGTIHALDYDQIDDVGAYPKAPEPASLYRMHGNLSGAHKVKNIRCRNRVILTNKTPSGLNRGFGGPQHYFALERLVHQIAVELKLNVLDVIKINLLEKNQFPYKSPSGALLDSGNFQKLVKKVIESSTYKKILKNKNNSIKNGKIYGIGYSAIIEPSISNMGYVTTALPYQDREKTGHKGGALASTSVSIGPTGSVYVTCDSLPQGQGHETILSQVVADVFGVKLNEIFVNSTHDTHKDSWSIAAGNYSSRFAGAVAGSAYNAAINLKKKLQKIAASELNCKSENVLFDKGKVFDKKNSDNYLKFKRLAGIPHWSPGNLPENLNPSLKETCFWGAEELSPPNEKDEINGSLAYGFVFDVCGLEIDPITSKVKIDKYVTGHDAGKILNPLLANGQIYGAYAHAVGAALLEEFKYNNNGSFLSGSFQDYHMPTTCEINEPEIVHIETPSPFTPLGAKGLGEGNCMSTPVAIANAFADATKIKNIKLPLTNSSVHEYLNLKKIEKKSKNYSKSFNFKNYPINGSGEFEIKINYKEIWNQIFDYDNLYKIIPGCKFLKEVSKNNLNGVIKINIGPVKGEYLFNVSIKNIKPKKSFEIIGNGHGELGNGNGKAKISIINKNNKKYLSYSYGAKVDGKIMIVGNRLINASVKLLINQTFQSFVHKKRSNETILKKFLKILGINI